MVSGMGGAPTVWTGADHPDDNPRWVREARSAGGTGNREGASVNTYVQGLRLVPLSRKRHVGRWWIRLAGLRAVLIVRKRGIGRFGANLLAYPSYKGNTRLWPGLRELRL
jgi:hypothetical protein